MTEYFIVNKDVLPDYYAKVIEIKEGLHSKQYQTISEATQAVGLSRSTYYKYKDSIFRLDQKISSRTAVLNFNLSHAKGTLSHVLNYLSNCQVNVLTISQSLPINQVASVLISLDISESSRTINELLNELNTLPGVHSPQLLSVE